jgi:hypothetical protein
MMPAGLRVAMAVIMRMRPAVVMRMLVPVRMIVMIMAVFMRID